MMKRFVWTVVLLGLLFYGLVQLIFQLSVLLDSTSKQQTTTSEEVGFLFPPVLDSLPEATNSAELSIHGIAQNAHSVELFVNGISKQKVEIANKDESFIFDSVRLFEGENAITAVSYAEGKKSNPSDPINLYYKKGSPKLVVEFPEDGAVFSGDQKNIEIRGLTDAENTVTVNGRIARIQPDGSFRLKFQLGDGDIVMEFITRDRAGNENRILRTVHYTQ